MAARAVTDALQLLTLPEVAERLRLSRRTVDKLVAAGELRVVVPRLLHSFDRGEP